MKRTPPHDVVAPTRRERHAITLTFVLHLAWELGQARLFRHVAGADHAGLVAVATCVAATLADVALAAAAFVIVAVAVGDRRWPLSHAWARPALA